MPTEISIPPDSNQPIPDVPEISRPLVQYIPDEIQDNNWVAWGYITREGKPTKVPYQTNGCNAKSTDPQTWTAFNEVVKHAAGSHGFRGVGRVFSPDDGYCGIDFDNCLDEWDDPKPWAKPWLERLRKAGAYLEYSPSGTGIKAIVKATLPGSGKNKNVADGKIECYDRGRFFTFTGEFAADVPDTIGNAQDVVDDLLADVFGPERETPDVVDWEPTRLSNTEVIERASNDKTGDKFRKVWDGDLSEFLGDDSAADWHVAGKLNFYTGDPHQTERIMRSNPNLYRSKWDTNSKYLLERTIMGNVPENFFDPHADLRMTVGNSSGQRTKKPRKGLLAGAVNLGELMRQGIEPPDELIDGVLLEGRTHQVFCGPGKGKSWLALWMAVKLVNRGLRVLYLDKENGARIIRNRLVALGAYPTKVDECLVYIPFPSLDLEPDAVQDYINSLDGFSLVIFDSWINYLAAAGLDENSNGDLARWSTTFCAEARKRNISVLLLDHVGKDGNGSRGASRKLDEMDVAWELRTLMPFDREQVGMVQLRRKKDREAWLAPTVEFEIGGNPFVMKRVDGVDMPEPDSIKNTLAALAGFEMAGAKYADWMEATKVAGTGRTQFTEARKILLSDGRVIQSGGRYHAAEFSPATQPDLSPDDLVREPEPDRTGLVAENAQSGAGMGESRSGGGPDQKIKPFPQSSPARATTLGVARAGLVDQGSVNTDPDVQGCGACKTTARFEFHGDTKNCGNCGQDYPYEEHERRQREGAA